MAWDLTQDFKGIVKQRRGFSTKEEILRPFRKPSQFSQTAQSLIKSIGIFHQRLVEYRPSYLSLNRNLQGGVFLTDQERDELDEQANLFYLNSKDAIAELQASIGKGKESPDQASHQQGFIEFLNLRLSRFRLLHKELKTLRLKSKLEKKEMAIHTSLKVKKTQLDQGFQSAYGLPPSSSSSSSSFSPSPPSSPTSSASSLQAEPSSELDSDGLGEGEEEEFSQQERQQFAQEGEALMREFNAMIDEVRAAEKKVLEISSMQTVMESHVLHQATQIEHLYDESVETTETIKRGNQSLTDAKKNMSGSRKMILIFLLLASLMLLFLDWYG